MGRALWAAMVVVAELCCWVNEIHSASLPPKTLPHALNSLVQEALAQGLGYYPLEALIAQRILFLRLTSIAKDLGNEVHDAMDTVKAVGYHMIANSSLWSTVTPELTPPPHDHEIHKAVKGVVRDYQNHRAWLTRTRTRRSDHQTDKSKIWYSRMVDRVFSEKLPNTELPPPPAHAVPRCFSFFSSPEVDTEVLEGLQGMATDVTETLKEQSFFEKLVDNLYLNTLYTTYSFAIAEFLEEVGLGEITSTGLLVSDIWLFHEVVEGIWEWSEERCFLFTKWPFTYFYPEHCRQQYHQEFLTTAAEGVADVAHGAAAHAAPESASH
ncbi:hypothetical protein E2C01_080614 [Portunus trituberculatus]|uniref:Uncharacterized protein n=1 Tax=Portunus trituberculatus TaxID=210409 RepID=A0A5B7IWL0_PORTR|nr:hypothetical protein [Portunus trituberculatus]